MSTGRTFHQEVDLAAVVGQFLINTRAEDLPIELVQNELDAGSSCTEVTFGEDAIVCQGDGESVDEIGWERLRKFLGAGGAVAAKADGIGGAHDLFRAAFRRSGSCPNLTGMHTGSSFPGEPGAVRLRG